MRSLGIIETGRLSGFMPKALDTEGASRALKLNFTDRWMSLVEDWRKHQTPVPNVSAAIRQLVEIAAESERLKREKSDRPK